MIGVLQRDELALPRLSDIVPILQRHFQRHFHGGRAVIGEENVFESAGQHAPQSRGKLFGGLVRESGKDHVFELARLSGDSVRDERMRVAVQIHPPGRDGVDEKLAASRYRGRLLRRARSRIGRGIERLLRERMPDGKRIAEALLEIPAIEFRAVKLRAVRRDRWFPA